MLEISPDEVSKLLSVTKPASKRGRKAGVANFSEAERLFFGVKGFMEGVKKTKALVSTHTDHDSVSQPTVNNAINGKVGDRFDADLNEGVEAVLNFARANGSALVLSALQMTTSAELKDLEVKDRMRVTSDISNTLRRIEKKESKVPGSGVTLNLYVPNRDIVPEFETIEVED